MQETGNLLIIRWEGNIGEDRPSDTHVRDITLPAKVGNYKVDFGLYHPKYRYELQIKSIREHSMELTFNGEDYTVKEGENKLFDIRKYQASYDGPWFTGVDWFIAIWKKERTGAAAQ